MTSQVHGTILQSTKISARKHATVIFPVDVQVERLVDYTVIHLVRLDTNTRFAEFTLPIPSFLEFTNDHWFNLIVSQIGTFSSERKVHYRERIVYDVQHTERSIGYDYLAFKTIGSVDQFAILVDTGKRRGKHHRNVPNTMVIDLEDKNNRLPLFVYNDLGMEMRYTTDYNELVVYRRDFKERLDIKTIFDIFTGNSKANSFTISPEMFDHPFEPGHDLVWKSFDDLFYVVSGDGRFAASVQQHAVSIAIAAVYSRIEGISNNTAVWQTRMGSFIKDLRSISKSKEVQKDTLRLCLDLLNVE